MWSILQALYFEGIGFAVWFLKSWNLKTIGFREMTQGFIKVFAGIYWRLKKIKWRALEFEGFKHAMVICLRKPALFICIGGTVGPTGLIFHNQEFKICIFHVCVKFYEIVSIFRCQMHIMLIGAFPIYVTS